MRKNYFSKFIYTALISAGIISQAAAQDYSISPSSTVTFNAPLQMDTEEEVYISNLTSGNLTLFWEVISNELNPGWDSRLCDYGACYIAFPNGASHQMDPIPPATDGYFKLTINPETISANGKIKLLLYSNTNAATPDTVVFNVNSGTAGINSESTNNASITAYPNPANQFINVKISDSFSVVSQPIVIYNIIGEKVFDSVIKSGNLTRINTAEFPAGIYFIRYQQGVNSYTKKFYVTK